MTCPTISCIASRQPNSKKARKYRDTAMLFSFCGASPGPTASTAIHMTFHDRSLSKLGPTALTRSREFAPHCIAFVTKPDSIHQDPHHPLLKRLDRIKMPHCTLKILSSRHLCHLDFSCLIYDVHYYVHMKSGVGPPMNTQVTGIVSIRIGTQTAFVCVREQTDEGYAVRSRSVRVPAATPRCTQLIKHSQIETIFPALAPSSRLPPSTSPKC